MQRLKTRSQFQAVLTGGVVARTVHFAMHRADLEASSAESGTTAANDQSLPRPSVMWMGALVPKRLAKRAVTRNAIRRQIYSFGMDFRSSLPVTAHVVRLRAGFDTRQFISASSDALKSAVRGELQQLFTGAALRRASAAQGS
ncbi:MAG: ribonuclease P protein component [Rhodoferax sp.]